MSVAEGAAALLELGQQLLHKAPGGEGAEQPTVCLALVPPLLAAGIVIARAFGRRIRLPAACPFGEASRRTGEAPATL